MLEHARAFVLRLPIVIPCLLERVVAYFNISRKIGESELFFEETEFDFFLW